MARPKKVSMFEDITKGVPIIGKLMGFLVQWMCESLAKRFVIMILIAAGLNAQKITELTGAGDRMVRELMYRLEKDEDPIGMLRIKPGRGHTGKLEDIEDDIVAELEKHDYHSRRQIADMILEKFGIGVSVWTVGKLLKKKDIRIEKPDHCQQI